MARTPDISEPVLPRDRRKLRRRVRRRRLARTMLTVLFWLLVLSAVFVMGLGFGRVIGGESDQASEDVTIDQDLGVVTATLPVRTVTTTKTVTRTVRKPARRRSGR